LERHGDKFVLKRYALLDAPIFDKKISVDLLSDHLNSLAEALGNPTKYISVAVGVADAVVRSVELPQLPADQMRTMLKMNHKNYMQQDLPNYVFDFHQLPSSPQNSPAAKADPSGKAAAQKVRVLAAATKQQLVDDLMKAASAANLVADAMVPSLIGPINAFEQALPEVFKNETIALVDIGFKHTSVCVLDRGELGTNRTINIGGDQITSGLADTMGINYAEAEGIKVGMAPEVEAALQMQILPLGREIRASMDFFEHQFDRPVSQVYVSGATARSEMIIQMLHSELLVECKAWNPAAFLQLALSGQQAVEIDHVGPQLAVAIGTALSTY
jgi:type IV pilus assembly protein PilM